MKPANILMPSPTWALLADFGIAKLLNDSQHLTMTGFIVGTAAYMAPEQAAGKPVDKRADIWAFGVVLYEMLTGRRAFEGETVSDTLAAVLRAEPDRALVPKDLPRRIRSLLDRCLEKDPRRRLRDVGEIDRIRKQMERARKKGDCVRIEVGVSWECSWVTTFSTGSITVEGPFLDGGPSVLAVTGGTGAYREARGSMRLVVHNESGTEFEFIFRLLLD